MRHRLALLGVGFLVACGSSDGGSPAAAGAGGGGAGGDAGAADIAGSSNVNGGGGATAGASAVAGATSADAGAAGTEADAGAAGTASMYVDCDLVISAPSETCNLTLTEFPAPAGQGATMLKSGHPQQQGIHTQLDTKDSTEELDISVSGDAPSVGAVYNVNGQDAAGAATVTFSVGGAQLFSWNASLGGVVSVKAVKAGAVSGYSNVTFHLDKVEFSPGVGAPKPGATPMDNQAAGTFKLSGNCTGAISK